MIKNPTKKIFHKNFLMREFSPSDIWIDVFRKFCCDINKCHICLVIVYFGECTWPVAFERTHLQGLTHSRSWDIWIDVHVVFRWFQPYYPLGVGLNFRPMSWEFWRKPPYPKFEISTRHQVSINTSKTTNFSLFYLGIETHEGLLHEKLIFHWFGSL